MATYTESIVSFDRDDVKLEATLRLCQGSPVDDGVVIVAHGFCESREIGTVLCICDALSSLSISTLRYDLTGCGKSGGKWSYGGYERDVLDMAAAVRFVKSSIKKRVLAVAGHSRSGSVSLMYAGSVSDVPLMVNVAGRYHMNVGWRQYFSGEQQALLDAGQTVQDWHGFGAVSTETLRERTHAAVVEYVDALAKCDDDDGGVRVVTIHGDADEVIPVQDARDVHMALGAERSELVILGGADHSFTTESAHRQLTEAIVDFANAYLLTK
jgi:uncharacterized protein